MPEIFVETGGALYNTIEERWGRRVANEWIDRMDEATIPIGKEFARYADNVLRYLWTTHRNPWNGQVVNQTQNLQRRSGKGIASIMASRLVMEGPTLNDIMASFDTGTMTIHETGGTIRARNSRFLTIPLPAALDRRGLPKKRSAREWPNTFVRRSRAGNLIIFQNLRGRLIPLYLLKPQVTIPARLGMGRKVEEELPRLEAAIIRQLELILGGPSR